MTTEVGYLGSRGAVNFVGSYVDGKYLDFFQQGNGQMVLNFIFFNIFFVHFMCLSERQDICFP